jgi:hypothetical protein
MGQPHLPGSGDCLDRHPLQWQAKLAKDPLGSRSPYLTKILATHWVRTLLINTDALILLVWAMQVIE